MFVLNQNYLTKKEGFYYSCPWIEHGLVFFSSKLTMCCFCGSEKNGHTIIQDNFDDSKFNIKRIFENKNKFRRFHKKGKIHLNCMNCPNLKLQAWDERDYIDCVYISHWLECNCKCSYCYSTKHPEEFQGGGYKIYDILKSMIDEGILRRDAKILFGGGEPALLNEFEKIINLLLDSGFQNIRVHSSGIKYIPALERGIKEGKIHLAVSIDAGSSQVYEKIKQVPLYDIVRENIRKYAAISPNANVSAKYIIIPDVNDTKEEIEKWLIANKEAGLKYTILDIEENWYLDNKNNIPDYIYELLRYTKMRSDELGTHFELYERIENLLN